MQSQVLTVELKQDKRPITRILLVALSVLVSVPLLSIAYLGTPSASSSPGLPPSMAFLGEPDETVRTPGKGETAAGWARYTQNSQNIYQGFVNANLAAGMSPEDAQNAASAQYQQWGQSQHDQMYSDANAAPFGIKELAPLAGNGGLNAPLGILGAGLAATGIGALSATAAPDAGGALGSGLTPNAGAGSTFGTGGGSSFGLGSGITPGAATETIGGGALGSGVAPGATGSIGALSTANLISPEAQAALNSSFQAPLNPDIGGGLTPKPGAGEILGAGGGESVPNGALQNPTYPTQPGMGGQGLTVPSNAAIGNPASFINDPNIIGPSTGIVGGSGYVPYGTPPALGDPNSFINQGTYNGTPVSTPPPTTSPFSTNDLLKLATGLMGGGGLLGGGAGGGMLGQPTPALQQAPANIFTPVGPGALHPFG
jgi:hypothetical protein